MEAGDLCELKASLVYTARFYASRLHSKTLYLSFLRLCCLEQKKTSKVEVEFLAWVET